ncbi:MAG: ABC transporter ATP-binding protein, partial [Treponema sp.]|nr:ABC transporter ATP-binding protein [Treponema sp.]
FSSMTVLENVLVAAQINRRYNLLQAVLTTGSYRKDDLALRRKSAELLKIFDLEEAASAKAGSLPYGHQRKLESAFAAAGGILSKK